MSEPNRLPPVSRRAFVKLGAVGALTAASYSRVLGANQRIGVGFIGYGLIGKRHVLDFQAQPDVNMAAVAEVHRGRLDEATAQIGGGVRGYGDFRKLLEDRQVDAVCISTADHWHALATMLACAAGKDVYVEKPVTLFPREGQWMTAVARRHQRVIQVGTQQRSGAHYARARQLIRDGRIGRVLSARMGSYRNIMPGYGNPPDGQPPAGLDWNLMLGPAPWRPYNPHRAIYHFRWFWDYSGGQMTNLGQHSLDIVDWFLAPRLKSVASVGGRFALRDNGETPDTQDSLLEFDDFTAVWSCREASAGSGQGDFGLEFFGTKGTLAISRGGFRITADRQRPPANTVPQFTGAHPVGGPQAEPEPQTPVYWTDPLEDRTGDSRKQFVDHVRNFLDCIKTRGTPVSDLESGVRVSTWCQLANLSLRLGRRLDWDAEREDVVGDADASQALVRQYRKPWDAELSALGVA